MGNLTQWSMKPALTLQARAISCQNFNPSLCSHTHKSKSTTQFHSSSFHPIHQYLMLFLFFHHLFMMPSISILLMPIFPSLICDALSLPLFFNNVLSICYSLLAYAYVSLSALPHVEILVVVYLIWLSSEAIKHQVWAFFVQVHISSLVQSSVLKISPDCLQVLTHKSQQIPSS